MKKILIIEDDRIISENLFEFLREEGYQAFTARDGVEGIQIAKDCLPDLILCDIMMPKLDGIEVFKLLSTSPETSKIPFIFITARTQREDIKIGMQLGVDDYITKPFSFEEVLTSIKIRIKKNEEIQKNYQLILESIFNAIDSHVYVSDYETNEILFSNWKLNNCHGYNITGKKCYTVFYNKDKICSNCKNQILFTNGIPNKENIVWEKKDVKSKRYFQYLRKSFRWIDGRNAILEISSDITLVKESISIAQSFQRSLMDIQIKDIENINFLKESITNAYDFQRKILPSESSLKTLFPQSFVFFQPKDIVSGDFYWLHHNDNSIFLIIADCTGHGIRAAFISMLSSAFLFEIVNENKNITARNLLFQLHKKMKKIMPKSERNSENDSIEISVCEFDKRTNKLTYVGINLILYLVQGKKKNEIVEVIGNRICIGTVAEFNNEEEIVEKTLYLNDEDIMYLTSDGFIDQEGDSNGSSYTRKKFKHLLASIAHLSINEQKNLLRKAFENWKGTRNQTDDIIVMGVKVHRD